MLFASLPFADEAGSYIEVGGEDGLTGLFAGAEGADLLRRHLLDRREAERVELTHGLEVHSAAAMEVCGGLVDCCEEFTGVFSGHWCSLVG